MLLGGWEGEGEGGGAYLGRRPWCREGVDRAVLIHGSQQVKGSKRRAQPRWQFTAH